MRFPDADGVGCAARFASKYGDCAAITRFEQFVRPVEWHRVGITEVFLYIPNQLVFRPAGG